MTFTMIGYEIIYFVYAINTTKVSKKGKLNFLLLVNLNLCNGIDTYLTIVITSLVSLHLQIQIELY